MQRNARDAHSIRGAVVDAFTLVDTIHTLFSVSLVAPKTAEHMCRPTATSRSIARSSATSWASERSPFRLVTVAGVRAGARALSR
jgi:hypothetical protein